MDLTLTPEMQRFVEGKVKSGRYGAPEDVVRAALVTFMQQESLEGLTADELEVIYPGLRQKIAEGLADLREGRFRDGEEFFDELDREDDEADRAGRKTA